MTESIAWSFAHTVEASVPMEEAWAFWTDVANWTFDTSLEWVKLDGPFVAGTKGLTKPTGAEPIPWLIRDAEPGLAVIEIEFPGAVACFRWSFSTQERNRTQISQSVTLSGPSATQYVAVAESQLATGIPAGMSKLVDVMEQKRNA